MVRNEELKNFAVSSSWLGCKSGVLTCVTEDFDPNCWHQNCQGCILAFIFVSFRAQSVCTARISNRTK